jgi:GrpB-like predicted nucleotidyltransferase (UPF0157 family)
MTTGMMTGMAIEVVAYSPEWPVQFERVAGDLRAALTSVPGATVEHVGSTSVPGLAAKPILDIDVLVDPRYATDAIAALAQIGYVHRGDLGVVGREAFDAPDDDPRRNVYVCQAGTLNVRNHLAVRDVLRRREDLRDEYAAVKLALAADPQLDIDTYLAGKSAVLQKVLAESDLTDDERRTIWSLNDPSV